VTKRGSLQIISACVIAAAVGLFYQNCAPQAGVSHDTASGVAPRAIEAETPATPEKLIVMNQAVDSLAAQDLSCAKVEDCTAIAVGSRACGGPQRYVVTSSHNAVLPQVESQANEVTQAERALNRSTGANSICSIVEAPELTCTNAICAM
jgi:hypothetical protein